MTLETRMRRLYESGGLNLPFPGQGKTAIRHRKLADLAASDLPLARLAEAHADAVAILAEANRTPHPGLYGVWAAETTGQTVTLAGAAQTLTITGPKVFCSGAGLIDRALVATADGYLVDVSLRDSPQTISIDNTAWKTSAFAETNTAQVIFSETPIATNSVVGRQNWYLNRPGFWHGACGPAACWAGGAFGLYEYAQSQSRDDAHTLAHLAAMHSDVWALGAYLDCAGQEIDSNPTDCDAAMVRALTVRHLIEQAAGDILRRLGRAYGPRPLAYDACISKRYQELELYIRQCHAERDLEVLGRRIQQRLRPLPA